MMTKTKENRLIMKQKEGFVLRDVCGENVIIGEGASTVDFGKLLRLNETAAWLWNKAAELGEFTVEELADAMCQEYAVEKDRALTDVKRLTDRWVKAGLAE